MEFNVEFENKTKGMDVAFKEYIGGGGTGGASKEYVDAQDEATYSRAVSNVPSVVSDYVTAHKDELKGDKGAQGDRGPQGETGPQGIQGLQGNQGERGPAGPQGTAGADGAQGPKGDKGEQGEAGAVGPQGPQGPKGDAGTQGATGPQGATGAVGPQGANGADGYTPQRSVDYWTATDIQAMKDYIDEAILGGAW